METNMVTDKLSDHFSELEAQLADAFSDDWQQHEPSQVQEIGTVNLTIAEVLIPAKQIDTNKSSGIDYISSRVIRNAMLEVPDIFLL